MDSEGRRVSPTVVLVGKEVKSCVCDSSLAKLRGGWFSFFNANETEISPRRHGDWCLLCLREMALREAGRQKSLSQTVETPTVAPPLHPLPLF